MFGAGNFFTTQNCFPPSGPPFPITSADNGLSVDPVTGHIVLGNNFGQTIAALLSNREIPMDGFSISFTDQFVFAQSFITGGAVGTNSNVFAHAASISADSHGGRAVLNSDITDGAFLPPWIQLTLSNTPGNEDMSLYNDRGAFIVTDGGLFPAVNRYLSLDRLNRLYQMGDINLSGGGTVLQVNDPGQQFVMKCDAVPQVVGRFTAALLPTVELGDLGGTGNGTALTLQDVSNRLDLSNTLGTAVYSINGNPGVSGVFIAGVNTVTVEGGIVTSIV